MIFVGVLYLFCSAWALFFACVGLSQANTMALQRRLLGVPQYQGYVGTTWTNSDEQCFLVLEPSKIYSLYKIL